MMDTATDTPCPTAEAVVLKLPPDRAGRVLHQTNILLLTPEVSWPVWLPILQFALGFAIAETVGPFPSWGLVECLLLVTPIVTLAAGLLYQWWYIDYLPSRFFLWRLRREVRSRPDAVVRADNPDAVFVQVIPRCNWKVMLENASDVGFLAVDEPRSLLLFEGDAERWVIPFCCVRWITIEEFCPTTIDRLLGNRYPMTVLQGVLDGAEWEACIGPRQVRFERRGPAGRRRDAESFTTWLKEALGRPDPD